jgi:endoglucanase
VIPFMDGSTVVDRGLFEQLRGVAEKNDIPWQTKEFVAGGTDASAIQRTKNGVRVCIVSAPVRYLHAPASVCCIKDFENIYKLVRLFVEDLAAQC